MTNQVAARSGEPLTVVRLTNLGRDDDAVVPQQEEESLVGDLREARPQWAGVRRMAGSRESSGPYSGLLKFN